MKIRILTIAIALINIATAQISSESSPLVRARGGDDSALVEMEQAGDLQELRTLLADSTYAGKTAVRLSLARMGDEDALQYFACESLTDNVDKMQLLLRDELRYIGGAFSAHVYRELLNSDPRFLVFVRKNTKHRYSDVMVTLPSTRVLQYLPKLLPNANIPSPYPDDPSEDEIKSKWKSWIDEHQDEILAMRPSADGINFSSSFCADLHKKPAR